jgi:Zn finger protein HypA/HybF involved in hydrogenase expression
MTYVFLEINHIPLDLYLYSTCMSQSMPTYEDEYEEDEFEDDDEFSEDEAAEGLLLACEDCDYRWKVDDEELEYGDYETICPMCGSSNVVEI